MLAAEMNLIGGVRKNKSGFRGVVRFERRKGKVVWVAQISVNGKTVFLGKHATAEDAARTYDTKALELWGPCASLNFPNAN